MMKIINAIIEFFREVFSYKNLPPIIPNVLPTLPEFIPTPVITPTPVVKDAEPEKIPWDTKENCRKNIRIICDDEGLSLAEKDIICEVIHCESNFNPQCIHPNKNQVTGKIFSTDYGICQMNSFWYIGPGKPIKDIDEALNDPEKCVRVMIQRYKEGGLRDWVCYSSGLYKK